MRADPAAEADCGMRKAASGVEGRHAVDSECCRCLLARTRIRRRGLLTPGSYQDSTTRERVL